MEEEEKKTIYFGQKYHLSSMHHSLSNCVTYAQNPRIILWKLKGSNWPNANVIVMFLVIHTFSSFEASFEASLALPKTEIQLHDVNICSSLSHHDNQLSSRQCSVR